MQILNLTFSCSNQNIQNRCRFVEKLCSIIPNMEPQEVPPLVYQLLFLCDQSDYLAPLQHLATYFQEKLSRCREVAPAGSQSQRPSQSQRSAIDHDRIGRPS